LGMEVFKGPSDHGTSSGAPTLLGLSLTVASLP
jgi:hypothetical protein